MEHAGQSLECTVGVVHVAGGILFFKNRDLGKEYLANRLTVFQSTPETHALKGADLQTGELAGVAIGVNRHGICVANTHVVSTPDVTYDVLCERLVHEAREKAHVPGIVADFMVHNTVQGGRILVSSPGWSYLVEVLGKESRLKELDSDFVMTNSFSLISCAAERPEMRVKSSANRLSVGRRMIQGVSNVGTLKSMLRSHVPEKGELSICNHRQDGGGTESSHIIQVQGELVTWSSAMGYPCESDYHTIQLFQ